LFSNVFHVFNVDENSSRQRFEANRKNALK